MALPSLRLPGRRAGALVAAAFLLVLPFGRADALGTCIVLTPASDLRASVLAHGCVILAPGTYTLDSQLTVPTGHDIYGGGTTRADVVIKASATYASNGEPNLLLYRQFPGADLSDASISEVHDLTLEGRKPDGTLLGALMMGGGWNIDNVALRNTKCYGLGITNYRVGVTNSLFEYNGLDCATDPPGAGIYVIDPASLVKNWAPQIVGNEFRYNDGPSVDSAGVTDGVFRGNTVHSNKGYAGFALFGSARWLVEDNRISHSPDALAYPYPGGNCHLGAYGRNKPAGIFLCQKSDVDNKVTTRNTIRNNTSTSYWGILLVGNDEEKPYWAPRANTLTGNTTTGSNVGCADDFKPGQWYSDDNVYSGNSCTPTYF